MSTDWLSQPLSIQSIASQYKLPVVIRSALGFRGSSQPIILHSKANITFAFGRALKRHQSKKSEYQSFRPIDSEIVAIPLKYSGESSLSIDTLFNRINHLQIGYFECLLPTSRGPNDGVNPERSLRPIVDQMRIDRRPQTFYIAIPMRVYTLATTSKGKQNRLWHKIDAHQLILMEQLTYLQYTPTENDNLTAQDYEYVWFCISKRIIDRNEYVMKCFLSNNHICYIPCSSTEEICLYPVGQPGSANVYKLQTIENLIGKFSLPINIKLIEFPGSDAYKDFSGQLQLLGSRTKEFAVCASLSSTNVSLIPVNTSLKFVVVPIPLTSAELINQLSRCQMFIQSFDQQIRRIIIAPPTIPSHQSRSKSQSTLNGKRLSNIDQQLPKEEDQITSIDEDYRSGQSTEKKRSGFRQQRAISTSIDDFSPRPPPIIRTLSTGNNNTYDSLVHPIRIQNVLKQSPVSSPKKAPHSSTSFTYDTGSHLMKDIDLPNANGAILMDNNEELFSPGKIDYRLS